MNDNLAFQMDLKSRIGMDQYEVDHQSGSMADFLLDLQMYRGDEVVH